MNISDKKIASIKSLEKLLINFVESDCFDDGEERKLFIDILVSQRKLAAYENKKLGIISSSLNTLKSHADLFLKDGYHGFNILRVSAFNKQQQIIKKINKKNNTKNSVLLKLRECESDVEILRQQNMQLVLILQDLKRMSFNYASKASPEVLSLCKKELRVINSKLSYVNHDE